MTIPLLSVSILASTYCHTGQWKSDKLSKYVIADWILNTWDLKHCSVPKFAYKQINTFTEIAKKDPILTHYEDPAETRFMKLNINNHRRKCTFSYYIVKVWTITCFFRVSPKKLNFLELLFLSSTLFVGLCQQCEFQRNEASETLCLFSNIFASLPCSSEFCLEQ